MQSNFFPGDLLILLRKEAKEPGVSEPDRKRLPRWGGGQGLRGTADGETKAQRGEETCSRSHSQDGSLEFRFQAYVLDQPVNVTRKRKTIELP